MQTVITNDLAFGFPGEHANGQPFRADMYVAGEDGVTFGCPAYATGDVVRNTGSNYVGMVVGPHQHVKMVLPSDAETLTVDQGTQVAVAARGCWFAKFAAAVTKGAKIKANGAAYELAGEGDTAVGTVVAVDETGLNAIVRLGE